MCESCGCGSTQRPEAASVEVLRGLLADNDRIAGHNREHFDMHGLLAVNLMSSPGAGKTALLEASIVALRGEFNIAVIVGDLETENDARRIRAYGIPALQIVTGTACHLDAAMIHNALHRMPLAGIDILFIENVGNLVCPACFRLGQHRNAVLLAVTEGDDKPAKYPVMFRAADSVVISKTDLLPYLDDFDIGRTQEALLHSGSSAPVFALSARRNIGMAGWLDWIRNAYSETRLVDSASQEQMG